jgi:hypothetical protein
MFAALGISGRRSGEEGMSCRKPLPISEQSRGNWGLLGESREPPVTCGSTGTGKAASPATAWSGYGAKGRGRPGALYFQ